MPIIIPITFYYLLPSQGDLGDIRSEYLEVPYTPIGLTEEEGEEDNPAPPKSGSLTLADKWGLVRPLLVRYMLPLCKSSHPDYSFPLITEGFPNSRSVHC